MTLLRNILSSKLSFFNLLCHKPTACCLYTHEYQSEDKSTLSHKRKLLPRC